MRLSKNSKDVEALTDLAMVYVQTDKYDNAIGFARMALETDAQCGSACYVCALACHGKKDYTTAWKHVQKAQELGYEPDAVFLKDLADKMKNP